ncbi:MAG TPA: 3-isopropylmalate dehydratase small subunit, partial [Porticoccaceae bacterium]|nr:3-isopropylmalate dehydratase small subunit [Porticoccaceae bacterium]
DNLFNELEQAEGFQLTIDLARQTVVTPAGEAFHFDVDAFRKKCLLEGLDDIGLTLQHAEDIRTFEQSWRQQCPWLFDAIS